MPLTSDSATIKVGEREIGRNHPCFVIAEAGVNHNGSLDLARKLVDAAAEASADAVKFQTFKAEGVMLPTAPKAKYQEKSTGAGETQFEMVQRLELPLEAFRELSEYSKSRGILFLSTPFDAESIDYLTGLDVPAFKVPSGEAINHLFLEQIAAQGKPIILSTGMCSLLEVDEAVRLLQDAGANELALLHCVSNYPADPADANLRAMLTMEQAFGVPVGYSDHTPGIDVAGAAVALGACIIEKHFTLDRKLPGPDHQASLEPDELAAMVRSIRTIEEALGSGEKRAVASEANTSSVARRSLVLSCDVSSGTRIEKQHLTALRPADGIAPNMLSDVIGRPTTRFLKAGTPL
jgi:N,N'-diacetyllegionaminate synthase